MAIPKFKRQNIIDDPKYIDENGVPEYNASTKYALVTDDGKKYPPKYVVAVTGHLSSGTEISTAGFNADEAKSYTVGENTIMYIDQTAGSSGVSFDFIPRSTPDCLVILTGEDLAAPVRLGFIRGQGSTVTGSVSYLGTKTTPTVTLNDGTGTYTADIGEPGGGTAAYSFASVLDGEYTLTITKAGHLPYSKEVTIDAGNTSMTAVALLAGNSVSSEPEFINSSDLAQLLQDYKKDSATGNASNFNEDDFVNSTDLSLLLTNYKKAY